MSTDETPDDGEEQRVLLEMMTAKPNDDDDEGDDDDAGGGEDAVGGTTAKDGDGTGTGTEEVKKDDDGQPTDTQPENKEDMAVAEGGGEKSVDGNDNSDDDDGQPPTKKQKLIEEGQSEEDDGSGSGETTAEKENGDETKDTVMEKTTDGGGEDSKVEASDDIKATGEGGEDASIDGKKEQDPSIVDKKDEASQQKATEAESGSNEDKPSDAAESSNTKNDYASSGTTANPYDSIKYKVIQNDGRPETLIKLVALKSLFSKQLPKMPRAYIARLVFDRRHISLAILNVKDPAVKDTDEEVIGAICYRPFHDMKFAEIAFCAVNSSHQVKGYGTKLMNLVKQEGAKTGIEYFITYADNYAIGYFKKQGFSKQISMPKGRYQHLIKDYDGGTMMECYVHPSIDFTRVREMLEAQRQFVLSRIRLKANSTKVYDALPADWKPDLEGMARGNELAARAMAVPGIAEAGWTIHDMQLATGQGKDADRARSALRSDMLTIVRKVDEQQFAWPFREPVDTDEVKDYLEVIKEPIDLSTIDKRIRKGDYYKSKKMLYTDLTLMVNNCKLYNEEASAYVQCAVKLENYLKQLFKDV
eukprot:CAMPEP_0113492670 /NCGR_PEP_ID=MMETSP0014_2-20120614/28200_1 /TAXON_ID=2857 /ORGANISM="Nitzschia sp." /LENGTH=586 /DNA_ID=CAMNT_0000386517 /DNA_START=62 /DNA_END=1822 /DNA_ORIENTATION=+ /assembly_acc=CAM_ASM_000159